MTRVYATHGDLITYGVPPGVTLPAEPELTRKLRRASERVDDALLCAVYDVDDDGLPTKALVAAAMRDATCAQLIHWQEHPGSEDGTAGKWATVSIGSVALGGSVEAARAAAAAPGGVTGLCGTAQAHLRRAGLLSGGPLQPDITWG